MAEPTRSILIADPDIDNLKSLGAALKEDGYHILAAKDGSRALEQSIIKRPHLVIFDQHCPLLNASKFRQILRTNPRTEDIPLIVMGSGEVKEDRVQGYMLGAIRKPVNIAELKSYVAGVFAKLARAEEVQQEEGAISGNLSQMALVDLLQIFSMNRKTGQLKLGDTMDHEGSIYIREGLLAAAFVGKARGAKALYRLLRWTEGDFTFIPAKLHSEDNLSGSTDNHLMEGLRQCDELERLLPELPSLSAELKLDLLPASLPDGLHPVTAEIIEQIPYYQQVEELIDVVKATDLEAYQALRGLIGKGMVAVVTEGSPREERPLLTENELTDLRTRMRQFGLPQMYIDRPKLCLLVDSTTQLKEVLVALRQQKLIDIQQRPHEGWGSLGSLELGGPVRAEYVLLPPEDAMAPLLQLLGLGSIGTLVLGKRASHDYRALIARTVSGPVVTCDKSIDSVPGELAIPLDTTNSYDQGLRSLLHVFLTRLACYASPGQLETM